MRHWLSRTALVALALFAAPVPAGAQLNVGRYYNPFTGRQVTRAESYNPFTGRHAAATKVYNPWTGRAVINKSSHNHFTGSSGHFGAAYNPLTGSFGWRGYYRRQSSKREGGSVTHRQAIMSDHEFDRRAFLSVAPVGAQEFDRQSAGWREVTWAKGHPQMFNEWLAFGPESLYWAPKFVQSLWGAKEIFITENGCAGDEVIADDGNIYDTDRIMFARAHLTQLQRATADGVPVMGYFYWSTMDNFEWTAGFGNRFGLVHVDFKTQKRTPKLSAAWFHEAAKRNAVVQSQFEWLIGVAPWGIDE